MPETPPPALNSPSAIIVGLGLGLMDNQFDARATTARCRGTCAYQSPFGSQPEAGTNP